MIVGISGKIGCGKSYLANLLLVMKPEYRRIAFGDLLKWEVSGVYGFPLEWCYSQGGKEKVIPFWPPEHKDVPDLQKVKYAVTVRHALQWYGTGYRRKQDPDYWVREMETRVGELGGASAKLIIDDVRFEDEAECVKKLGGKLVRLDPYEGWTPGPGADHRSETALDDYAGFDLRIAPAFGKLGEVADVIAAWM